MDFKRNSSYIEMVHIICDGIWLSIAMVSGSEVRWRIAIFQVDFYACKEINLIDSDCDLFDL